MNDWSTPIAKLAETTGQEASSFQIGEGVGGGCINQAVTLEGGGFRYFVKSNHPSGLEMFAAEAEGLQTLAATQAVRVPTPVCWGSGSDMAFLVLEYLDLSSGHRRAQALLGRQLAAMHQTSHTRFGWHRPNTIGTTRQRNEYSESWVEFFRHRRLGYQLELAGRGGNRALQASGEKLLSRLNSFFEGYAPPPSLLHGDLWVGNTGETTLGQPVLFDPAVYFGDRETDLAMTELFGGFSETFYRSYDEAWPLDPGYATRKILYNLYHVLNHLNLFGRAYLKQAEQMIGALLAAVR
ncbi:MAG TPA: fructosamine kinase family protein [Burkholderiales bacterium]|jgi:fructosamine-3-kinase